MFHAGAGSKGPGHAHPIDHFPVRSIDVFHASGGARFVVRPVLPQDSGPLGAMYGRLSRMAHYNRFHGARGRLTDAELRTMTQVDYRRHMAVVITAERAGAGHELVVGDARYVVEPQGGSAEFAVVIEDAWQRMGLGERALSALGDAARRSGLQCLYGGVLESNVPMLALARRCGFEVGPDLEERGVVRACLTVAAAPPPSRVTADESGGRHPWPDLR
jgi:acetyltransferase